MSLDEFMRERRANLIYDLDHLASEKKRHIQALRGLDRFILAATDEAAYGIGFSFFGRMREAGDAISDEFEAIDSESNVKGADRRVQPFLRSQLFIALVAQLEDYVSVVLQSVLVAFPHKMGKRTIPIADLVGSGETNALINAAEEELNSVLYKKPNDYRKYVEDVLSMPESGLDALWPDYVEMKARRDVGLHANWKRNATYDRKVAEVGGAVDTSRFLGVSEAYFEKALSVANWLVTTIATHCAVKFAPSSIGELKADDPGV